MMEEFDTSSFSCSSLLCQETACFPATDRVDYENAYLNYCESCLVSEDEDEEYIEQLIQRETDFGFKTDASLNVYTSTGRSWLECARLDAIEWIFNTREILGFQFHTAYFSVTYFDRFLSKRTIYEGKLWAIRLLSIACLSLAAKMEECRVPALSEYPIEDYQFESKVIQRMELLVLSTLEWKMGSIPPFAYLHYFISKFYDEPKPEGLVSKALGLILAMTKEISLVDYRPSIIAAAAVLAASGNELTMEAIELKIDFIPLLGSLANEHVFSCYTVMQEIEIRNSKTPKSVIFSNYSSVHYTSSVHAAENPSAVSAGAGTKRKLTFNESDQNSLAKKICRP